MYTNPSGLYAHQSISDKFDVMSLMMIFSRLDGRRTLSLHRLSSGFRLDELFLHDLKNSAHPPVVNFQWYSRDRDRFVARRSTLDRYAFSIKFCWYELTTQTTLLLLWRSFLSKLIIFFVVGFFYSCGEKSEGVLSLMVVFVHFFRTTAQPTLLAKWHRNRPGFRFLKRLSSSHCVSSALSFIAGMLKRRTDLAAASIPGVCFLIVCL